MRGHRRCHAVCFAAKSTPSASRLAMSVASGAAIALPLPSSRVMEPAAPSRWSGQVPRHGFRGGVRSRWSLTSTVAFGSLPARRAVSSDAVSPALVSPLWTPPFPMHPPFKAEIHRGGKPILGTQHGSLCVVVTPPCGPISAATIAATESGLGLPPPRRRLANPPRPPVNVPHTGRFSSSPLCECRSASGGAGSVCQPARLQRTRSQPFAERRRVKPPVCFLLSFDKLRAGSSQRLHAPAAHS
jgi:hypothetical protein